MKSFQIRSVHSNPLLKEFIEWANNKYNTSWSGTLYEGGFYVIHDNLAFCSNVPKYNVPTITLEHWNENVRNGELIGYKLIKPEYKKFAQEIGNFCNFAVLENYKDTKFHIDSYYKIVEKLKEAGVLDIWFEPVYRGKKELPKIGGYEGVLKGQYIEYGCARLPVSWFISDSNRSIRHMTLDSGVFIDAIAIEKIREYLRK